MSLSAQTVQILKAASPLLQSRGKEVTSEMYRIMTTKYPQVKNLFNTSHLRPLGDTAEDVEARRAGGMQKEFSMQVSYIYVCYVLQYCFFPAASSQVIVSQLLLWLY